MFDYDIRDKIIIYSSCLVYKGEIIIEHEFLFSILNLYYYMFESIIRTTS